MRKIKSENGITMMVLVVTIIVLSIIASIVIQYSINGGEYSKEKQLLSDLEIVQHAVYEQYEQYRTTGDESFIVGSKANNPNDGRITWEDNNAYWSTSERDKQYYVLKYHLSNPYVSDIHLSNETEVSYSSISQWKHGNKMFRDFYDRIKFIK